MTELERALTADSAFAPPSHILEGVSDVLAHQTYPGAPHTIYAELWHIVFWQRVSLDWAAGIETPAPAHNTLSFPTPEQAAAEPWTALRARFFRSLADITALTSHSAILKKPVQCPSPPGHPTRTMTIEDQLISLAAHNAYHLGHIVLLRQLAKAWPPPSGDFSW